MSAVCLVDVAKEVHFGFPGLDNLLQLTAASESRLVGVPRWRLQAERNRLYFRRSMTYEYIQVFWNRPKLLRPVFGIAELPSDVASQALSIAETCPVQGQSARSCGCFVA